MRLAVRIHRIIFVSAALIFGGTGCHSTIQQTSTDVAPGVAPLRSNSRVYVAMPEDALDKNNPVPQSGRRTALALQDAFKRHTRNVLTGKLPETVAEAIDHARDVQYEFVAFPTILKWQDRPTEWTGVRDKLQLKVDLISVETSQVLRSTMINGKGRWMTDGDDQPQDMLPDPVDKFVRSLFRMTYTPSALQ
jgi:hypothetical protein